MRKIRVSGCDVKSFQNLNISGSKSESNRVLILKSIFNNISIENLSSSDDTKILKKSLISKNPIINVGHAGTSMRFLTAYLATLVNKKFILSGSKRMHERPIAVLVDALNYLGFKINFIEDEGYPPLEIIGAKNIKNSVKLNSSLSSQYISALMLIAPTLKNGLVIELDGKITSRPYIDLTLSILQKLGIESKIKENFITIKPQKKIKTSTYKVESDWSSVSYFFSIVALSNGIELSFKNFRSDSNQGDRKVCKYYELFGIKSKFQNHSLVISKQIDFKYPKQITIDLNDNPDLAQTIIVTSFGLNIPTKLTGLSTLKIKETDRLVAMHNELTMLGAKCEIDDDSIEIFKTENKLNDNHTIKTYDDHRMALSFAPLSIIKPLNISNPDVVTKSFPEFWNILKKINFSIDYL